MITIGLLVVASTGLVLSQQSGVPTLTGAYLGQEPPGETPELFAADVITENCPLHGTPVFTPDSKEVYWGPLSGNGCEEKTDEILFMRMVENVWTEPAVVAFSSRFWDSDDPAMSPDGTRIYFTTHRPSGLLSFDFDEKVMYVEREGETWSSPRDVGSVVNSMFRHWQVSVSRDYDLYFHAERNVDEPGIYVSEYVGGEYQAPKRLPDAINSGSSYHPYIAPDESFMIFVRTLAETGDDLFISFRGSTGEWTEAENLGDGINSPNHDFCPNVTPDGRYLFFISQRDGYNKAYWLEATFIERMRSNDDRLVP